MKKKIIAIILAVVLISAVATGVTFGDDIFAVMTHREFISAYDNYPIQSAEQGNYILESTKQTDENNITVFSFVIKNKETRNVVFECPYSWRAWDLKYIGFVDETEVLVVSADVGCMSFRSENSLWVKIENPYIPPLKSIDKDKAVFVADNYDDYFTE